MEGIVFDIERNSMSDGPGIRTVVFLKGCPLRCVWCHNPESIVGRPQLLYEMRKCVSCGRCAQVCTCHEIGPQGHAWQADNCTGCGSCEQVCLTDALTICGKRMTVRDVLAELRKDRVFYASTGGGMTLSGGESLAQPKFALALAKAAREENINVCVETSGFAQWSTLEALIPYVDYFLYDWKATEPETHRVVTGCDNALILENLSKLNEAGVHIVLRCPMVPGLNDSVAHLEGIADLANRFSQIVGIDVEPYSPLGRDKRMWLGMTQGADENVAMPNNVQTQRWITAIRSRTDVPVRRA